MTKQLKITINKVMYRLFGAIPYAEFKNEIKNDRLDVTYHDSKYNSFDANTKPFNLN
jgi:hypothetical protein